MLSTISTGVFRLRRVQFVGRKTERGLPHRAAAWAACMKRVSSSPLVGPSRIGIIAASRYLVAIVVSGRMTWSSIVRPSWAKDHQDPGAFARSRPHLATSLTGSFFRRTSHAARCTSSPIVGWASSGRFARSHCVIAFNALRAIRAEPFSLPLCCAVDQCKFLPVAARKSQDQR